MDTAAGLDAEQAVELAIGAGDLAARRQGQQRAGNHFVQAEQIAVDGTHLPLVHQQLGIAFANLLLERSDPRKVTGFGDDPGRALQNVQMDSLAAALNSLLYMSKLTDVR